MSSSEPRRHGIKSLLAWLSSRAYSMIPTGRGRSVMRAMSTNM